MSLLIWAWNNWLKRMNRHPSLLPAMWLNWSNCSLDSIYRPLVNIWNVSIRLHFILSALCWSSSQNYGNTKGQAFGLFVPNGCIWGPCGPACPLLLCDCVSAVWSDVTLRRHYPHHCASLPLCTGNQLWQPWPSNLIGPVTLWPAAIEMVLKLTTITCRPLDYCNNTPVWTQVFCFWPSTCFYLHWTRNASETCRLSCFPQLRVVSTVKKRKRNWKKVGHRVIYLPKSVMPVSWSMCHHS